MVAPADQPRRVLHYQAALVRDGDGYTARYLELGWLCAAGRDLEEALARLRDLVAMELHDSLAQAVGSSRNSWTSSRILAAG